MFINWYGVSDSGRVKEVNQDTILCDLLSLDGKDIGIFAVADGVGGLEAGEIASAVAVNTLRQWWDDAILQPDYERALSQTLQENIHRINLEMLNYQYNMATTLSVLLILDDRYYILHIGDSRIYRYRNRMTDDVFEQLTLDHSSVVTASDRNGVPYQKGVLTDCLGRMSKEGYYSASDEIRQNDLFLLCSDGIYKTQSDKEIKRIISRNQKNPAETCNMLINGAKIKGETDNISAIAVKLSRKPFKKRQ